MATNTYRIPGKSNTRSEGGIFTLLEKLLRIDESLAEVIHIRFLPQIVFVSVLTVIYIGSRHTAEKKIRAISTLETEVEDLRADFTTLKHDYMFSSKQSELAKKAAPLGLQEPKEPPFKIIVPIE